MNRTALRKILAEEGLLPSRTASAPTALAKLISTAPGYESLSSRDTMGVAKTLIKTLLDEVKDRIERDLDTDEAETTDYARGEYEKSVGRGGGPSRFGPGGDEAYYDVTEDIEYDYPSRMKIDLEVNADLGGAGFPDSSDYVEEEDLFEVLGRSRLWQSIVKDAIKGMWRKWMAKAADEFFTEQGLEELDNVIGSDLALDVDVDEDWGPFRVDYHIKSVRLARNGEVTIALVLTAGFEEPQIT